MECRVRGAALAAIVCVGLAGCDPYRDTRPITIVAKPPLIQRQSCMALRDAEREDVDAVVMMGTAVHGAPDMFRTTCGGEQRELLFALAAPPDDLGMKDLRKQWNKKTGKKDRWCARCPKYDLTGKFVGMVKKDESGRLVYVVQSGEFRKKRVRYKPKD